MTNKAIKNYYKNKPIIDAANDTVNVMCVILLTAHRLFPKIMYPKAVCSFLDDRTEYCKLSDEYEKLGIFDFKMQQACDETGIETNDCAEIVRKYMHPINNAVRDVYVNNLRLMLLQLQREHGIGRERRARLVNALMSENTETRNAVEEIKAMGANIDMTSVSSVDYKKYRCKPDKVSLTEQRQAESEMQWLRNYQQAVMKRGE